MESKWFLELSRGDAGMQSDQMPDFKFPPVSPEVFRDEAAVAVVGYVLAAEQATLFDDFGIDPLFDLALFQ